MWFEARPYQVPAAKWLYARNVGAIFGDLGSGKTGIVLLVLETLRRTEGVKALLIAPKNVKDFVWTQEARKFDQFRDLKISSAFAPNAHVHLTNPESLHKVPDWGVYTTLVIDESTDFKNPTAVRFLKMCDRLPFFRRRYILTAGPIPNGYKDLWAQIYLLDFGFRLGENITAFRERYLRQNAYTRKYEELPGAFEIIREKIADIVFRVDLSQHRDTVPIPERHDITVPVVLRPRDMAVYKRLECDLVAELQSATVTALSAGELYGKCKQFTAGFLYSWPEGCTKEQKRKNKKLRQTHWIHHEKLHALGRLHIEKNCRPFLVVFQHEAEGAAISRRFGCPLINSKTKNRGVILEAWDAGKLSMLACQIGTVARGLNMQFGGSDLVIYSIPDNMDHLFQVRGRLHRPGAKHEVNVYFLTAVDTIDEMKLAPRLDRKLSRQQSLLTALTEHYKSRAT